MRNRAIAMGLAFSLSACGGEESLDREAQQQHFTEAVESVAYQDGEPYEMDSRVPCDFDLLIGELTVRKVLADEKDFITAVVEDSSDQVPEFGLIQCFDDNGNRIVRGADGF